MFKLGQSVSMCLIVSAREKIGTLVDARLLQQLLTTYSSTVQAVQGGPIKTVHFLGCHIFAATTDIIMRFLHASSGPNAYTIPAHDVTQFRKCDHATQYYRNVWSTMQYTIRSKNIPKNRMLTAASRFAGDSSLGSASIEITLTRIVSTVCIGNQRSSGRS